MGNRKQYIPYRLKKLFKAEDREAKLRELDESLCKPDPEALRHLKSIRIESVGYGEKSNA